MSRVFNTGSPRNIPAGSQANLDDLKAFYQRKNEEAEAARIERSKTSTDSPDTLGQDNGGGGGKKEGGFASDLRSLGIVGNPAEKS